MKKTVIIGAANNPSRYAYMAGQMLTQYGHEIVPLGIRKGEMQGKEILDIREKPAIQDVDTVTMYINPARQEEWREYILSLKPKRIIFNPGTENGDFEMQAEAKGTEALEACTLVMLRTGQY